jgi:pimeloyl-ACP methyl ester carboxylesterase
MTLTHAAATFDVAIPATTRDGASIGLPGRLTLPESAIGLVLFAHGSGSSRFSPRNTFVASVLHEAWIGTLLFDLLTPQEETGRANVFDIRLLADRLAAAVRFVTEHEQTRHLSLGLFGASTGAAAALVAAAEEPRVAAVVSRGGRRGPPCPARSGWRSCRGRRISSRSPARSRRRPGWRRSGVRGIWDRERDHEQSEGEHHD